MALAKKAGGLYRDASGSGFHDAHGKPIAPEDVPDELLSEAEGDELTEDFPGFLALTAAGLKTKTEVFAHPDLDAVPGIGPKTLREIEALRPVEGSEGSES
jgi:hypothetical protein